MSSLSGRTVLVTGASSGIGEHTVREMLDAGAVVYAAARRIERMKDLERRGAILLRLDVTDEKSMDAAVGTILKNTGPIDILVNNAGYGSYGAIEDVPLEEARRQFEVNIFGLAHLTNLVLPGMRANGYGRIVNISSMGGKVYTPYGGWYHATKHALEGLTDCLRLELRQFGIHPILIEPGGIRTDWGIIAAENLKKTSGTGAYAADAVRTAERMSKLYAGHSLSEPSLIAKTILRSVTARRPRPRYVAGKYAKVSISMRHLLGDRIFDRLISSMM